MDVVLVALVAAAIGAVLAALVTLRATSGPRSDGAGPPTRRNLVSLVPRMLEVLRPALRDPLTQAVTAGALRCARRSTEDGPLVLGGVDVHAHPADHELLLDMRELLEKAVRRRAEQRGVRIGASPCVRDIVVDAAVPAGDPAVTPTGGRHGPAPRTTDRYTELAAPRSVLPAATPPAARSAARLVVVGDHGTQFVVPSRGGVVGRDPVRCAITVDLPTVSRLHAELRPVREGFVVVDRDSANGVRINGRPVLSGRLGEGDVLGLGRSVELRLVLQHD